MLTFGDATASLSSYFSSQRNVLPSGSCLLFDLVYTDALGFPASFICCSQVDLR